jgi:hypothetical protein
VVKGYATRALTGAALMLVSVAVVGFSIYKLAKTGTCASGGPYVSARECPAGTELYILAIFPGVIGFLLGGWIFSTRGRARGVAPGLPPQGDRLANPDPFTRYPDTRRS